MTKIFGSHIVARRVLLPLGGLGVMAVLVAPGQATSASQGVHVLQRLQDVLTRDFKAPRGASQLVLRPTARVADGYFDQILLSGKPVQIKKLRISELFVDARNVRIDVPYLLKLGKIRTLASKTRLKAVITQQDLTALLAQGRSSRNMGLVVTYFPDQRIQVSGNWRWSWFSGPVVGIGKLRLMPGHKINFDILSLTLNGAQVPQFVKDKFSEQLNPIIDYNDLPFLPHFRSVRVVGTKAIIEA